MQQVHPSDGVLRVNKYTYELMQWLKLRGYLHITKTRFLTDMYNLEKE